MPFNLRHHEAMRFAREVAHNVDRFQALHRVNDAAIADLLDCSVKELQQKKTDMKSFSAYDMYLLHQTFNCQYESLFPDTTEMKVDTLYVMLCQLSQAEIAEFIDEVRRKLDATNQLYGQDDEG